MIRLLLAGIVALLAAPAPALTGREVVEAAQKKNGFSTWRDRTLSATMATYASGQLTRSRDLEITEETGVIRRFDLSNLRINPTLGDALFRFTPPGGVRVVERRS